MIDFVYQYDSRNLLCVFLGGFSLLALLEWARPKRELTHIMFKRWFNNIVLMICSSIITYTEKIIRTETVST